MKKNSQGMMLTEVALEEEVPQLDVNLKHELLKEL